MNTIREIYNKVKYFADNYSFEMLLIGCIAFILLYALYRKIRGEKGSWSSKYYYTKPIPEKRPFRESSGEIECRRVLEKIFGRSFAKARPDFLANHITGGHRLELDCYNADLKLALEFDGVQHFRYIPYFHKTHDSFTNQKYRDDMKNRICKERGITLIRVPHTVKLENIEDYIKTELKKHRIKF